MSSGSEQCHPFQKACSLLKVLCSRSLLITRPSRAELLQFAPLSFLNWPVCKEEK